MIALRIAALCVAAFTALAAPALAAPAFAAPAPAAQAFAASALAAQALGASAPGSAYARDLKIVAVQLERAARHGAYIPFVHVPPAPLGGPPRYSPSVDDWLQAALNAARQQRSPKARATDLRAIASALRYLAGSSAPNALKPQPPRDVDATAARILADPKYRAAITTPPAPPKQTIWEKFLIWLFDKINSLFEGLARATQGMPFLGTVFAVVLVGIAVLGLAFVAYRLAQRFVVRRRPASNGDGEPLPDGASADLLHAAALAAARQGSFARAVALLFQASLVLLDRSGRVAYDPARTAGEYRRLVRRKAQFIAADFDDIARIFTAAAYAEETIGERDWTLASTAFAGLGRPFGAE